MKHTLVKFSLGILAATTLAACGTQHAHTPSAAAAPAVYQPVKAEHMVRKALAPGLYEVVYSPRQNAVFVASAGGRGEGAPATRVLRLNPQTLEIQAEIALDKKGYGLGLDDATDRLYVGHTVDAAISVIDTTANRVVGAIQLATKIKAPDGTERYPHSFRQLIVDAANHRIYTPGLGFEGSALYVVNTRTQAVEKVIPELGFVATGGTLDAAGNRLFVSNLQGQLFTLDTRTLAVARTTEAPGDQLLNVAYDPTQARLFVTDQGQPRIEAMQEKFVPGYKLRGKGNQVLVIDANTGDTVRALPTGDGPVAVLVDAPRARLYVTNRIAGTITVFDSKTLAQLDSISLPSHPNSLALDTRNNVLYATIKNGEKDPQGSAESVVRIAF